MSDSEGLPKFDDAGINLADPYDRRGLKTAYISLLQQRALERYVGRGAGKALDVGCGYGRMCDALLALGYKVTGVDPSQRVLSVAAARRPQCIWRLGSLPDLPFSDASFDLVCLFNVARALHLMGKADVCAVLPRLVAPNGRLVVIDNLRHHDSRYLPEEWFDRIFARDGLRLVKKIPIRASRWPVIYLIRYGLIPSRFFPLVADWELRRMAKKRRAPRWSYFNYLFIFERS